MATKRHKKSQKAFQITCAFFVPFCGHSSTKKLKCA